MFLLKLSGIKTKLSIYSIWGCLFNLSHFDIIKAFNIKQNW